MALYRPSIPLEVKCRVALRQLGNTDPDTMIKLHRSRPDAGYMVAIGARSPGGLGRLLPKLLAELADMLGCPVEALRLDHDPALALREKRPRGLTAKWIYTPDANDPNYLAYRPHGAEYAASHDVKTRIRGDHGQFSDITLIKRERRRERKAAAAKAPKLKLPKYKLPRGMKIGKSQKYRWPKRSFRSKKSPTAGDSH